MGLFTDMIDSLISDLRAEPSLSDIKFIPEYSTIRKANPVTTVTATLGFKGVEFKDGALGEFIKNSSQGEVFGKRASLKVSMDIYSPHKLGGEILIESFDKIAGVLVFGGLTQRPGKINATSVKYNTAAFAFVMETQLDFELIAGNEITESAVRNIIVRGVY